MSSEKRPHIAAFDTAPRRAGDIAIGYRSGSIEDLRTVASLARAVYGGDLADWLIRMRPRLALDDYCLLIAHINDLPIGYGRANGCQPQNLTDAAPAGLYLTGLIVLEPWRRYGVGTGLTVGRLKWIWSHDEPAWFFTNARNEASLAMHAKLGFFEVGRAASYLGEPFDGGSGVLMRADVPT